MCFHFHASMWSLEYRVSILRFFIVFTTCLNVIEFKLCIKYRLKGGTK